jgi:hypothetical protein
MVTLTDRLAQFFTERPSQWVDGRRLSEIAGAYAWRSRCSDLRLQRGMTIENRVRVWRNHDGSRFTVSEYRFVPKSEPVAQALPLEHHG